MNKRGVILILLVMLLMIVALIGLPVMTNSIVQKEMRGPVIVTCTPMPVDEMDDYGKYEG